jgi:Protein of unknown function (DUF4446)
MSLAFQLYAPYLWSALVAIVLVLAAWVITLQIKLNRLIRHYDQIFAETGHGTFEAAMNRYVGRLDEVDQHVASLAQLCDAVENGLRGTVQRIGIVRFNPFSDTGSDQSFAVALLDANGTGLVMSSLFNRTTTRLFAKSVVEGRSTYVLTNEEREAIEQAMTLLPAKLPSSTT